MAGPEKRTDTIPRASIEQLFSALMFLHARAGRGTFEGLRLSLIAGSRRRAPHTPTAMWTVARDVLTELEKLKLASVGVLPRKLSDVSRLREAPCELLSDGAQLVELHMTDLGRAYDTLLSRWLAQHSYFRALTVRMQKSPLYLPDITNIGQLGHEDVKAKRASAILSNLVNDCATRLQRVGWLPQLINKFRAVAERRIAVLEHCLMSGELDAKRLVDTVQDTIVLPALLETEELPFDPVTFQQLLRASQEFLIAAWTASHPDFSGRVAFPICKFHPTLETGGDPTGVVITHHGISYAESLFPEALQNAYSSVTAGSSGLGYASAYAVRAIVCLSLQIPPAVFAKCLELLISLGPRADLIVYTELPFEPPPQGEDYVEVSKRRIGRLKLVAK